jgi:hypothetical protein
MTTLDIGQELDPVRFPSLCPQMGAILWYLFGHVLTTPALTELSPRPAGWTGSRLG